MIERVQITSEEIEAGLLKFKEAMEQRLKRKGSGTLVSVHEWFGHVVEEYDEFADAVHLKDKVSIQDEALDLAVITLFGYICLKNKKMECKSRN